MERLPSDSLLEKCSQAWGLHDLTFVRKMENIVFSCQRNGEKVFLRLTTPLRRKKAEIQAELDWITHLEHTGLRIPKVIADSEGNQIVSFSEEDSHYEAVVFALVEGEHPSKETASNPKFLKALGRLIAKMHKASEQYQICKKGTKREEWDNDRGFRHARSAAADSTHTDVRKKLEKSVDWMQGLSRTSNNYGLVHADLGALNLFVKDDNSIGIIDFDDSCYHWLAFDLAIVIYSMASRFEHPKHCDQEKQWLANLVEGYREVRPLTQEEVDQVPSFMDFACQRLFFWIENHQSLNTFHKDSVEGVKQMKKWALGRIMLAHRTC